MMAELSPPGFDNMVSLRNSLNPYYLIQGLTLTIIAPELLLRDERFVLVYRRYRGASVISVLTVLQDFRGGISDLGIVRIH